MTNLRELPTYQSKLLEQSAQLSAWLEARGFETAENVVSDFLNPRMAVRFLGNTVSTISGLLSQAFIILLVTISMIFWGWVLGPVGMLLSVPLTMAVKIVLESLDETRPLAILMSSGPPKEKEIEEEATTDE